MRNRAQGFTLIEILVVITIIASLAGAVLILVPKIQDQSKRTTCANNLRQLGAMFVAAQTAKPGRPPAVGASLWLHFRKIHEIQEGKEAILMCDGDQTVTRIATEADSKRYDDVDLSNPDTSLCSYMGRDFDNFPMSQEAPKGQIIGCDRNTANFRTVHHRGGLNVLWEDTAVQFLDRQYLQIEATEDIIVGPESPIELLKQVTYGPQRKD